MQLNLKIFFVAILFKTIVMYIKLIVFCLNNNEKSIIFFFDHC